ncbi:Hypothetical_protein [Hexamita inflata]|uniref:Hypothetical_protein n=1 Tax=Hexamita inflata TaxID=28002 RepID=A0AA86QX14_9EUKA|nr:Hypothetical protein HINF_LOCUS49987 [Hexamita inflata]
MSDKFFAQQNDPSVYQRVQPPKAEAGFTPAYKAKDQRQSQIAFDTPQEKPQVRQVPQQQSNIQLGQADVPKQPRGTKSNVSNGVGGAIANDEAAMAQYKNDAKNRQAGK